MEGTKIVLASQSPRRKELLERAGIEFTIIPSTMDENSNCKEPDKLAEELALTKARDVAQNIKNTETAKDCEKVVVIGADTVVAKDELVLGKPVDEDDAVWMISQLQGDVHQVYTGVAFVVLENGKTSEHSFVEKTDVYVSPMTEDEIKTYVSTGEPMDKAGAYGIQGQFCVYVEKINGDYSNVVGLPIARVYNVLKTKIVTI